MTFGEQLRQYRIELGLSIRALANKSGLDAGHLSSIERGKYRPPKLATIYKVAEALGLSSLHQEELVRLSGRIEPHLDGENGARIGEAPHDIPAWTVKRFEALERRVTRLEKRLHRSEEDG
jgi:transcriptional regulator with XRE-family HTH domain